MSAYEFLSKFFARLNKEKITYCILRNYEDLPEKFGNDVDIWVKDEHGEKFYELVRDLASTLDYTPRLTIIGEGDYFLIKESDNFTSIIHIDCWTYIHWKGIPYIKQSTIENNLQWYEKGFYILSPEIAISIMLLKELLQYGKVKEKYKDIIKKIAEKNSSVVLMAFGECFGRKYGKIILELAKNGNWETLEKKTNKLRTILLIRSFLQPLSQFKWWLRYFCAQFRRFFVNSRGIFLVFIGPDGSGKSTTANNLIESEIKRFFQKKYYFHGHFPYLPEMKKIVSVFKKNKSLNTSSPEFNLSKSFGTLRSMIYPIYYGFNYFLGHFFIWKEKARAGLIIFDRYFYDYYIQSQFINCPRWLLRIIEKIIPKPDMIIFLKNKPEIIHSRKTELPIEEIQRQSYICEQIVKRNKDRSIVIETSTIEEVLLYIQKSIINKIINKQR